MQVHVESLLLGILSGIIASLLFHLLLKKDTPKIKISDTIAMRSDEEHTEYRIKVVNLRKRYVSHVSVFLFLDNMENGPDGRILREKPLVVYSEDIPFIDPKRRKDLDCKYAVRFRVDDNLLSKWEDKKHQYLLLRLYCIDEKSGSGKMFEKEYRSPNCIIEGSFETGASMAIR